MKKTELMIRFKYYILVFLFWILYISAASIHMEESKPRLLDKIGPVVKPK